MTENERLARWRLVLGGEKADGTGAKLDGDQAKMDGALTDLYGSGGSGADSGGGLGGGSGSGRSGGLGKSSPKVTRWLGDIRTYFPNSVVKVMQQDAMERLGLRQLLMEPEVLEEVEADVHLVSTLISLNGVIPARTKETARMVVRKVVEEVEKRLEQKTKAAISGALNRSARTYRPRQLSEINWNATIAANLKHYQADYKTIIPERLIGYARKQQAVKKDIILCIDQSGSMATSVVYSSIFAAVLASMRSLKTSMVVFDTAIVDMTEKLADPVDVLFGTQLGGGTDIEGALRYSQGLVQNPSDTIMVLISDLIEGGNTANMRRRAKAIVDSGVQLIVLLALSDDGAPWYDPDNAAYFASIGAPAFACTPDQFPDLIAAAIEKRDMPAYIDSVKSENAAA